MKTVILAGGLGSRLSEETSIRPKPMVEIGGKPILWHIMKIYSTYGLNDFIVCLGYKGYLIKEYFANYFLHSSDVLIDLSTNRIETLRHDSEPWRVTLVETGSETMTGGRLKRILPYVKDDEMFCFTYGDGLADIDIRRLIEFHQAGNKLVTVTATLPVGKFGALEIDAQNTVVDFTEKPRIDSRWVNGGFFVLSPKALLYIDGDAITWEREPLERLSREGHVAAFKHRGFWQPMDTLHDRMLLEDLWTRG
ncbi:MAG: glucose-1-phosphate cytidylyltransferase, partial [Candidatus Acidiferrales bacterium]